MGPPQRLPLPRGHSLSESRDGGLIVTGSRAVQSEQAYAGGWIFYAGGPGKPIRIDVGADISSIAASPDGRWVVTVAHHPPGLAKIWDARDGRLVKQLHESAMGHACFSPDDRWLSVGLGSGRLIRAGTWEPGPNVGGDGSFAPDGKLMAVQSASAVIRLVDPATGSELAALEDSNPSLTNRPTFSADGTKLIANTFAGGIRVWDLRLIRAHLAEMGLDWDAPPYPSLVRESESKHPSKLDIILGDLSKPLLTREQHARQAIEVYRNSLETNPDHPETCNRLAWLYLTAPEPLRDAQAALPLAEKAVRLAPGNELYGNTLGVAYFRAGRYHDAEEALRANLAVHGDTGLAFDLYFLAMCYHQLGATARALDHFNWAVRWTRADRGLSPANREELELFRAEAEAVLGVQKDSSCRNGGY
jgi:hypothetical protein